MTQKTITLDGEKHTLTPINLAGDYRYINQATGALAYLASNDDVLFIKGREVTHRFPAGSQNRKKIRFEEVPDGSQ